MMLLDIQGGRRRFTSDGYPELELNIPGWPHVAGHAGTGGLAYPNLDTKPPLVALGFIHMGPGAEGLLPSVTFPANPRDGRPTPQRLEGFTDDPAVAHLVARANAALDAEVDFERELTVAEIAEAIAARDLRPR